MLSEEVIERTRHLVDPAAGPGQAGPHGSPSSGCSLPTIPTRAAVSRAWPQRARCCWDHLDRMHGRMRSRLLCRLLRFWQARRTRACLRPPRTSLILWRVKPATCHRPIWGPRPPGRRLASDVIWGTPTAADRRNYATKSVASCKPRTSGDDDVPVQVR